MARKPRPPQHQGGKRRLTAWTLIALGLLVAGVWVASGWVRIGISLPRFSISLTEGELWTQWLAGRKVQTFDECGVEFESAPELARGWVWWRGFYFSAEDQAENIGLAAYYYDDDGTLATWGNAVVLWPIPLLLWLTATPILRSGILARRRANTGQCGKCGYSLAGLADGSPCPECGKDTIS